MEYINEALNTIANWLPKLTEASILLLDLWSIDYLNRWRKKFLDKSRVDSTSSPFLATAINFGLKSLIFISIIGLIDIQTISFAVIFVGVSIAIGNTFNGSLVSLILSSILLIFNLFNMDSFIETKGIIGIVKEISLFFRILSDPKNRTLIILNRKITSETIKNFSVTPSSRVDIPFCIGYRSDIEKPKKIVWQVLYNDPLVAREPTPSLSTLGVEKQ